MLFRSYYRLFGLPIHLPPLRDREKDALLLAKYFVTEFCKENKIPVKQIHDDARHKLMAYNWPGNIRELKSVIELSIVLSDTHEITADDITINPKDLLPELLLNDMTMREFEIAIVKHFMKRFDNNTKAVADKLSIGQTTVYRLLKEDQGEEV